MTEISKQTMKKMMARAKERAVDVFEEQLNEAEDIVVKDLNDAGMEILTEDNLRLLEFGNSEVPARKTKTRADNSFNAK